VVGYVGRLTEEKGAFDLVEAAARVLGGNPGFKLVMAGDGAGRQALESRIAALGILHAVELLGAVPHTEMASLYASMDVLALPSHGEGLPMCILEGMAAGCAVIASRVGGTVAGRPGRRQAPPTIARFHCTRQTPVRKASSTRWIAAILHVPLPTFWRLPQGAAPIVWLVATVTSF
jgi:hypothetical protein